MSDTTCGDQALLDTIISGGIPQRPQFIPSHICTECLRNVSNNDDWVPLINCPADFPPDIFEAAISQLIHHPEYNSTLILRSQVITEDVSHFPEQTPSFPGFQKIRYIHRRLLPRRPERDAPLDQFCTLYASDGLTDALVLTPVLQPGAVLPYYHPSVHHLAFRYIFADPPLLQIEIVPLPDTPTDVNSRLFRTCLSLLDTLHRYGWGAITNYKKRVLHDCLVPREAYQDLYLVMRQRHKHLVDTWREVTDPLKHVFEDIGIATFLILLWKASFPSIDTQSYEDGSPEPWKTWPRPPHGFLDLGCGNGLLTHILTSEGYPGIGIDVRTRTSWNHYPPATQAALKVHAFNPLTVLEDRSVSGLFSPGVFIIGNHADELTPWLPVVSTLCDAAGYISIPCCSWAFDVRYDRSSTVAFPVPAEDFAESLNLGGDGSRKSSYSMYRIWLASLSLYCGWKIECEALRIPSTRNWAIVGRRRIDALADAQALDNAKGIIKEVKMRGIFQTRKPEGNARDH